VPYTKDIADITTESQALQWLCHSDAHIECVPPGRAGPCFVYAVYVPFVLARQTYQDPTVFYDLRIRVTGNTLVDIVGQVVSQIEELRESVRL
jgi:uncharacterized Zn finger protein